ncbi:FkbM family methyltransferase [Xanthobacteraceae bacterium A53D]
MTVFAQSSRFIMDLGMNHGDDAAYYLAKGFEVVAVEANPDLVAGAQARFAKEIAARRFTLVEAAVWEASGSVPFHVNEANDHWSGVKAEQAGRANSPTHTVEAQAVTLVDLFNQFGTPFYLNVGVEGVDLTVLRQLSSQIIKPLYVSVEDSPFGHSCIQELVRAGYDGFKLLDLTRVEEMKDADLNWSFAAGASGPFAGALPGRWLTPAAVEDLYATTIRTRTGLPVAGPERIFHIHATKI